MKTKMMIRVYFVFIAAVFLFGANPAFAAVTVTPASGGTNLSADNAQNASVPAFTTLGDIVITEGAKGDFAKQTGATLILTAPTNWSFSPGVGSVTFASGSNISAASIVVTATTATITYTTGGTNKFDVMTISGLRVRANDGATLPSAFNIVRTAASPGTGTIAGITNDSTNFGSLSQVVGVVSKLAMTTQPGGATYGSALSVQPVVKTQDQFSTNSTTGLSASKLVSLTLGSGTGTLQGTTSLDIGTSAGNGTVTFSGITIGGVGAVGTGKSITAGAAGLTSASSLTFAIGALPVVLSGTRVYDTTSTAPFSILSVSNKIGADDVVVASGSGTLASANAGAESITSTGTLALGGTTAGNYTLSGATGAVTVTKATPTLSVTNSPVVFDAAPHSATVSGSVAGTASGILTGGATTQTNVGTYAVTANFVPVDTTNYNSLTGASAGNFVISGGSQTITFGPLSNKIYGDADFLVNASASSGLTVSFTSQTTSVCTVTISTVHIVSVGQCTIRASQAGNANYSAAPNVDQSFNVTSSVDVVPPVVTAFVVATSSTLLSVPITTFTATDNVAVTGYLITEASSTPLVGDTGWTTNAPTSYTFATPGTKTLYAWAKDAANNISTSLSATTTITIADAVAPIVTAFAISSTSSSLTIPITTFTATDNIGVVGYLITEASTTPSVGALGWTALAPATYTFATQGTKTLYAWAKDAAGNISAALSATVTLTFVEVPSANLYVDVVATSRVTTNGSIASSTQATFNQEVHVLLGGGNTVIVPVNTTLSASLVSDFSQLSATMVSVGDLPTDYTSLGAIQAGLPSAPLTANKPLTIQIAVGASYNNETLTIFKKEAGGTVWSSFTTCVVVGNICQFTTTSLSTFATGRYVAPVTPGAAAVSSGGVVSPTKVNFMGLAYPGSKIEVFFKSSQDSLYREIPQAASSVDADGTFDVSYTGLFGGDYIFGLQAEDKDGNKSGIVQATVDLLSADKLIIRDMFLPPTLNLLRTAVRVGDFVSMSGYAAVGTTIEVEVDGKITSSIKSGDDGSYKILISTAQFAPGNHHIRLRQRIGNKSSGFSSNKVFTVSKVFFPVTDLNNDGKIDIRDWSIFLSLWNSKDAEARKRIDFNGDGKVDVADFSIFMQSLKQQ